MGVQVVVSVLPTCQHLVDACTYACVTQAAIQLDSCSILGLPQLTQIIRMLGNHDWHIQQYVRLVSVPLEFFTTLPLAHTLPVCNASCIRTPWRCLSRSANLSLFLLGKHMDGDVRRLVVDVTDVSDERDVAYAHLRDMRILNTVIDLLICSKSNWCKLKGYNDLTNKKPLKSNSPIDAWKVVLCPKQSVS